MNVRGLPPGALGRHLLADFEGVDAALLIDVAGLEAALRLAASAAGATAIFGKFHQFGEGQGVTGVLLLKESHISIHTWPEFAFAAIDVFMCGASRPDLAIDMLKQTLKPAQVRLNEAPRGRL